MLNGGVWNLELNRKGANICRRWFAPGLKDRVPKHHMGEKKRPYSPANRKCRIHNRGLK